MERDFHGERRTNDSHASITDPDARLYRKGPGQEAKLCFVGHVLMENRHGLVVDAELTRASGHAERLAALAMLDRLPTLGPVTLAADRGFDARDFVMELRERRVILTSPRIPTAGARRSMAGPPATPATARASACVSALRKPSPGLRPLPVGPGPSCAASRGCAGRSRSRPPPTTWCACRVCSPGMPDGEGPGAGQGLSWPLADRRDGGLAGLAGRLP
jgi:hypothetical protein